MAVSLSRRSGLMAFIYWIWDSLDRTIFTAIKFSFPARFVSPFGFLGMLTFITFIILGVSGALLMFYYEPILDRAWDSVEFINNDVPFGFHIRNIHYHGSNAMVMLAILHMYYQYFSGRYKIRNEILWVTGVILGTVTILEAFTGYDIIFSERAELAISIAASLTNSIPIAGPLIRDMAFGNGFHDFVLRFYTQHVFILPIVMLGLMAVHFPRFLVFDVPMVMAISGAILITGGVFPVDLGFKFQPTVPPGITVPEWYLTGLYAFLRTQYDKFVTGVLWPGLFYTGAISYTVCRQIQKVLMERQTTDNSIWYSRNCSNLGYYVLGILHSTRFDITFSRKTGHRSNLLVHSNDTCLFH